MDPFNHSYFAGFDWARDHHDVVILDVAGQIVAEFTFDHTAQGWALFREKIEPFPGLAAAIETNHGVAVEELLASHVTIYPVNPRSAKAYRARRAPSGNKTDRLDALTLAQALRADGAHWRVLQKQDPLTEELRLLCRDEQSLIQERTQLVNQLMAALREYYPAALQAFEDWTQPYAWKFLERFPTPSALAAAGKRKWENFLHCHKLYRPETYPRRMAAFAGATDFCSSEAVTKAKSRLACSLVRMLQVLEKQLEEYRKQINQLFASHPDHDLFGSLPRAGEKLGPRLLSEIGSNREVFPDVQSLQTYAGTAPVSYQSGQVHRVYIRRACNKYLRCTLHLFADLSRQACPWAQAYYAQLRARGQSHAAALRCLAQRWVKIIWKMWQMRTRYDAEVHLRNQMQHGSWVYQLLPKKPS
jgi:transposase